MANSSKIRGNTMGEENPRDMSMLIILATFTVPPTKDGNERKLMKNEE